MFYSYMICELYKYLFYKYIVLTRHNNKHIVLTRHNNYRETYHNHCYIHILYRMFTQSLLHPYITQNVYTITATSIYYIECLRVQKFCFALSLVFCVVFCRLLLGILSFGHCSVCPSYYSFLLPFCYLQTFVIFILKTGSHEFAHLLIISQNIADDASRPYLDQN